MRYDSCRQCTKRRIKCDKGMPRCAKCVKKGLDCSGIGKTYQFVKNTTPDTISASLPAQNCYGGPRQNDQCDFPGHVPSTAIRTSSRSVGDDSSGFILEEDNHVSATVSSPSGAQHSTNAIPVHDTGLQTVPNILIARTTEYPLNCPVALYKPGQMVLLDHCKPTIMYSSRTMAGTEIRL